MTSTNQVRTRASCSWIIYTAIVVSGTGCRSDHASTHPEDDVVQITGIARPVAFLTRGEAIDADVTSAVSLTLPDAIERAVLHDPQLQAALARARAAQAEVDQARLLPNPILSIAFRFPEGGGNPIIEAGLIADLMTILQSPRRTSAAENRLRAACADVLTIAVDLVLSVQESYATIQSLDAQLIVLGERAKLIEQLVDLAKTRVQFGEAAQLDVLTLQTEQVGFETELIERNAARADERIVLARLIGSPSLDSSWRLAPWQPPEPNPLNERQWIAIGLAHRPEIASRRWELAAMGDEVALAQFAVFDGTEVGAAAERDPDWSVGPAIAVPIPLFDWGQARRAKAQAERIEARHNLTQTQREVVEDVRRAVESLQRSQQALNKVRDELIPLEQLRRQQAEAQYRNGFADIATVFLAEQDLKTAQISLLELQQKVSSARFQLERAVGGPSVASQASPNE